jgi:hypothetical protein
MLRLQLGGLCVSPGLLDEVLALPVEGTRKKCVLDLGSGSGIWFESLYARRFPNLKPSRLKEMAERYPWVDFTGVDLAPRSPAYVTAV